MPTSLKKFVSENAIELKRGVLYRIYSQEGFDAFTALATVIPAGILFIVRFDSINHIRYSDGLNPFATMVVLQANPVLGRYVVARQSDSAVPVALTDFEATTSQAYLTTSSTGTTGTKPSLVDKFGLILSAILSGQGSQFGVDITGGRAFIRSLVDGVFTSWREFQMRHLNDNTISTAKTSAEMNALYPVSIYPIGTEILALNNTRIYKRQSSTVWVYWTITAA